MYFTSKHILRGFSELLFPDKCAKCGRYIDKGPVASLSDHFCRKCAKQGWGPLEPPWCKLCGLPLPKISGANVCEACLRKPLRLGKIRAAAEYKGLMREAIHLFKYHSKLSLAKSLEEMIRNVYESHFASMNYDLLIPMPLHKKRLRQRGFNQAYILIRNLEKSVRVSTGSPPEWHVCLQGLVRSKKTAPQTGYNAAQRRRNLKNAFRVKDKKAIENRRILLVDDVITTGTTCNEAAKELLKNGAERVDAMVLARA